MHEYFTVYDRMKSILQRLYNSSSSSSSSSSSLLISHLYAASRRVKFYINNKNFTENLKTIQLPFNILEGHALHEFHMLNEIHFNIFLEIYQGYQKKVYTLIAQFHMHYFTNTLKFSCISLFLECIKSNKSIYIENLYLKYQP